METAVLLDHHKEVHNAKDTVYCRILHLSDLHLSVNSSNNVFDSFCFGEKSQTAVVNENVTDVDEILKEYGLRGYLMNNPVDCIVITGDFANRGGFSEENIQYIKERIIDLYKICAEVGNWEYNEQKWEASLPMNRLFYCAGNHDLLRDASCYDPKTGKYIARQNVVRELTKQQEGSGGRGYLPTKDAVKFRLLTALTFEPFYEMIESLRMDSEKEQEDNNFEGTVFRLKSSNDVEGPDICFAAINTALLAGNADSADPNTMQDCWLKLQTAMDVREKCRAAKDYYEQLRKLAGETINDNGKLCMPSEEALGTLVQEIRKSPHYIGIMLGHHNQKFFSESAKTAFNGFVKKCEIGLYLCGHTHRPDNNRIPTSELYNKSGKLQIRVSSGAFFDKTDYYSTLGFSIHTISRSDDQYFCESENIVYYRLPEKWMKINVDSQDIPNRFQMDVSKVEPSVGSASNIPPSGDGMGDGEDTDNRNPLMDTDCDADYIEEINNDETYHDAAKELKNMDQKNSKNRMEDEEVDKRIKMSSEILDQAFSSEYQYSQLPPDVLTSSDSRQKR